MNRLVEECVENSKISHDDTAVSSYSLRREMRELLMCTRMIGLALQEKKGLQLGTILREMFEDLNSELE